MGKKVLHWGLIALLIFYVVTQPAEAAGIARAIGNGFQTVAVGLGQFVNNLT